MKQLKLQVVLEAMDKATGPLRSINTRLEKSTKHLRATKRHLKTLEKSYSGVQRQHMSMQSKGIQVSQNLVAAENRLQSEIKQTTTAIEKQQQALGRLNQRARTLQKWSGKADQLQNQGGYMSTRVSAPVAVGFALSAKEAIAVEKSMASIGKFAPDFDGNQQAQVQFLADIEKQAADLSMQTGKTQLDIAAMFEEMGAAGVAAEKWGKYSEMFITGAVALDMEVSQLSEAALGIMAATGNKGNDDWLQSLMEKSNLSSDMGKMRAVNMLNVANRSMGLAKNAGISENAFMALTGAALDAGARDDVTGRAWKAIVARLTSTAKLTEAQAAAWDEINIDPEIFTKAFKKDPVGQMQALSQAAAKNEDAMGQLGIIIGTEFVDTVVKMGGNIETAKKMQAGLTDEQLRAAKFQAEYDRMLATTDTQLNRAATTSRFLAATLGAQLLPYLNALLDTVRPMIEATANWVKENPKLAKYLLIIAGAVALLGPFLFVLGAGIKGLMALRLIVPLFMLLAGAIKAVGLALLSNPILAALTGIAFAVAAVIFYWDDLTRRAATNPFLQAVSNFAPVEAVLDGLSATLDLIIAILTGDWGGAWDAGQRLMVAAIHLMTSPVRVIWDLLKKLGNYVGIDLGQAWETFKSIALGAWNSIIGKIDAAIDKIRSFFGLQDKAEAREKARKIAEGLTKQAPAGVDALAGAANTAHTITGSVNLGKKVIDKISKSDWADKLVKTYKDNVGKVQTTPSVAATINNDNKKSLNQTNQNTYHITVTEPAMGRRIAATATAATAAGHSKANSALLGDN